MYIRLDMNFGGGMVPIGHKTALVLALSVMMDRETENLLHVYIMDTYPIHFSLSWSTRHTVEDANMQSNSQGW